MKTSNVLLLCTLLTVFLPSSPVSAQFAGGSGSEEDPWQIETAGHLDNVRNYTGFDHEEVFFIQKENIDLAVFLWDQEHEDYINDGLGWVPIGDPEEPFLGTYLGNGYTVSGLVIKRPDEDYQGLFGVAYYARFDDVTLSEVDITGRDFVGGLTGNNFDTILSDCHVSGEITSTGDFAGGLIGSHSQGEVTNCHTDVVLTGNANAGGLSGMSAHSTIRNCYSTGEVTAEDRVVGGLIGELFEANLLNSYSESHVTGNDWHVGGLVGLSDGAAISGSHHTGTVVGRRHHTGGLAGTNGEGATIIHSYSSGDVTGEGHSTGGLVGRNLGTIENTHSTGSVTGMDNYTGGLVGFNRSGASIKKSYSTADVNGEMYVGGLVGYSSNATISSSYSKGAVKGERNSVGGLIGTTLGGTIENSFSRSSVSGNNWVGGLVGYNGTDDLSIINCYSTGPVVGEEEDVGGLVGFLDGNTSVVSESSYWNHETSGQTASEAGEARNTEQMTYPYDEDTFVDWDFEYTWVHDTEESMNQGYPYMEIKSTVTNVSDPKIQEEIAQEISLAQNYPNPFNPSTRINFTIPEQAHVRLRVYNVMGQHVRTLVNEVKSPGSYEVPFEAIGLSSGIYLYRLQTETYTASRSMLLVK